MPGGRVAPWAVRFGEGIRSWHRRLRKLTKAGTGTHHRTRPHGDSRNDGGAGIHGRTLLDAHGAAEGDAVGEEGEVAERAVVRYHARDVHLDS